MIPLVLLAAAVALAVLVVRPFIRDRRGWSTRTGEPANPPPHRRLDDIREHDPDFSRVLFEDFLLHLHAMAHAARGAPERRPAVRPYLREPARRALAELGDAPVTAVRVDALQILACRRDGPRWRVDVRFHTTWTCAPQGAPPRTHHTRERWTLSRRVDLRSRPPERARTLGCPNCGAPVSAILGPTCRHCEHAIDTGEFDWIVEQVAHQPRPHDLRAPATPGTDRDTLYDPDTRRAFKQLLHKDPTLSAAALSRRVGDIFHALRRARATARWDDARSVLGDALRRRLAAGPRDPDDRAEITNLEIVRCTSDRWYDAITVRLHVASPDDTADADADATDRVAPDARPHSEYWTLIRDRAVERDDATCPLCTAPLALTPAGDCAHCHAHLATPAPDWILARIEHADAYRG